MLKLVHSVSKPEVETAASKEPGIDRHQNDLAAVDRVRQRLLDYSKQTEDRVELQLLLLLTLTVQGYEDGLRESEAQRKGKRK